MTFVTADSCRAHLERLRELLFTSFPGSTIYQHASLLHVPHDVLNNNVDAVFLEAEEANSLDLMQMLHRQKPDVPVFIISKTDDLRERAVEAGANGYFVLPDSEQQLLDVIRLAKQAHEVNRLCG